MGLSCTSNFAGNLVIPNKSYRDFNPENTPVGTYPKGTPTTMWGKKGCTRLLTVALVRLEDTGNHLNGHRQEKHPSNAAPGS